MLNRISRHAPEWLRDLEEYIEIWKIYQLLDEGEAQIEHNINQFFLDVADEEGVTRWEDALGLPHTGTLEERRREVQYLLSAKIPYTFRWLKNYLSVMWNDPKPHVVVHLNGDYILTIQPKQDIDVDAFLKLMRKKIPANLEIEMLPAPIGIYDYYLGEGVFDSAGWRLLSSGIYDEEMVESVYLGEGVYEGEGQKVSSKVDKDLIEESKEPIEG